MLKIEQIQDKFSTELHKIAEAEITWENRTEDIKKILELIGKIEEKTIDPKELFDKCPDIISRLEDLSISFESHKVQYLNNLTLVASAEGKQINFDELLIYLNHFIELKDQKILQFFS